MFFLICLLIFNLGHASMIANNNTLKNTTLNEHANKPTCWVDEIRGKIIEKFTKKYDLNVCVISDAMPSGIINRTGVSFTIDRPVSKQKARQILVECIQDYIQAMNNEKELKPYLKDYPVTAKNIEVVLFIHDTKGDKLFYPNLGTAGCYSGCIEYKTHDPKDKHAYKTIEEEPFEEAIQKVKEELPKEDML